jgi:PKD repeat protein
MENQNFPPPKVKIIVPPKGRLDRSSKGKYSKNQFSKKKLTHKNQRLAVIISAIVAAVILAAVIAYVFPNWDVVPDTEKENITPIPNIHIENAADGDNNYVSVEVNTPVIFSAVNSTDQDGKIKKYMWDFGDGSNDEGVKVQHTYTKWDTYTVTLKIVDDRNDEASTFLAVRVNAPPVASIDTIPAVVPVNTPLTFSAASSYDPDWNQPGKGIVKYLWDFGDGNSGTGINATHIYTATGKYSIYLTVEDEDHSTDSISNGIEVVLKNFEVIWTMNNESALNRVGFTAENESSNLAFNITQQDLHMVVVTLNWTDFLPLMNVSDADPDEFRLTVTSPSGNQQSATSTDELIVLSFEEINIRTNYELQADSLVSATEEVNKNNPPSDKETGQWQVEISALDCPGGILLEDNDFFGDFGNSWHINVDYFYYSININEK